MADLIEIKIPDIGDIDSVEVIEILVAAGDQVDTDTPLISVESDKASMEIPSPHAGTVQEIKATIGQSVSQGDVIALIMADDSETASETKSNTPAENTIEEPKAEDKPANVPTATTDTTPVTASPQLTPPPAPALNINENSFSKAHASPSVRKFARELGADLGQISGSGNKSRILKEDVQNFIKRILSGGATSGGGNLSAAPVPKVDFSAFGNTETLALSKINKLTGSYLHSSWVRIPHVTQFDDADITDLEAFRKSLAAEYKDEGIKITLIAFILKAVVAALKEFPRFNASLDESGENLILKKYFHIGVAVNTPDGLVVPVIRDVDQKGVVELAEAITDIATRARDRNIKPTEMQGGCFTISSLGGVGGTAFTPIVNQPEVAILGLSRSSMKPIYQDGQFMPRLMLPMSLSYDHRVIDGVLAAQFTTYLGKVLADARRILL